jgi:SAM-dependent methyltransferase
MTDPVPAKPLGADYWNGEGGQRWLAHMDLTEALLEPLGRVLLDTAAARPGEAVLDVGCGGAATSRALASRVGPGGRVLGVDVSVPIIAAARARSTGIPQLELRVADAGVELLPSGFDLLVSRFGVMFFGAPEAAFANLRASLRPGARLAFLCWQAVEHNDWLAVPAAAAFRVLPPPAPPADPLLPGPFAFADPGRVQGILAASGFRSVAVVPTTGAMQWPDPDTALGYLLEMGMVGRALQDQPPEVHAGVAAVVRAELGARATKAGVALGYAAWLVTAGT